MQERLRSERPRITTIVAASGALALAAGIVGAYKWKTYQDAAPQCSQVMFAVPKGGPGAVQINVYPVIEGQLKPIQGVHGTITDGLNAGHRIEPSANNTHGIIENYRWDTTNPNPRWSRVLVSGEVDGRTFQCREQSMAFIPDQVVAGPRVPTFPPF